MTALLVALGGALGAATRHAANERLGGRRATLFVNALGSLLLGAVTAQVGDGGADRADPAYALVALGFCGAFTTFSAFALETARDSREGEGRTGSRVVTAVLTLALCVAAAAVGLGVARL